MGEREMAAVKTVKAVAAACQEAINTRVEAPDEAMRVRTPGGVFSVRWDARGSATALGQLGLLRRVPGDKRPVRGLARELPAELHEPERARAC